MQQIVYYIIENSAFLIALIALIFTGLQLYFQRKHNRLGVKPLFKVKQSWQNNDRSICIKNCGFGPATISKISLNYKGEKISFETIADKPNLADKYLGSGFYSSGEIVDKGYILDKGEELNLLTLSFHYQHDFNDAREIIFAFLKDTKLVISYKSIYNQSINLSVSLFSNIDQRYV